MVVSYLGSSDFLSWVRDFTAENLRGREFSVTETYGWRLSTFDFALSGMKILGHPVRIYLLGNEGLGFIAQPLSAKEVVYKNAHAIIGLTNSADDRDDLTSALGVDLVRLRSRGKEPVCIIAAPVAAGASNLPAGAHELCVDWRAAPLEVLKLTTKQVLRPYF